MTSATIIRPKQWDRSWIPDLLGALRTGKTVVAAARLVGIDRSTPYLHKAQNPDFAEAMERAQDAGNPLRARHRHEAKSPGNDWQAKFLEVLAETSNVSQSAASANIASAAAYRTRRTDPDFAVQWRSALLEGYEHLEMEVLAHLRGNMPDRKIDVANAIRQLAAHRKTVNEMRSCEGEDDEETVRAEVDALIAKFRAKADARRAAGEDCSADNHGDEK